MIEKQKRKEKKEEEKIENNKKRPDLSKLSESQDLEFGADGGSC